MATAELGSRKTGIDANRTTDRTLRGPNILQILNTQYVDSNGIPISSDRSAPNLTAGIDWEYQPCPFDTSASRFPNGEPHVLPISGLERRRFKENYSKMLSVIKVFRDGFINTMREDTEGESVGLTTAEMRSVLRGLIYLPHYLVHRAKSPIASIGALDPVFITLSNSASGSLGALEARFMSMPDSAQNDLTPDIDQMIELSENLGTMIGRKTVCVASPVQMRHFMASVVNGPHQQETFDTSSWFSPEEVPAIVVAGEHVYEAKEVLGVIDLLDKSFSKAISEDLPKNAGERKLNKKRPQAQQFLAASAHYLDMIRAHQLRIDDALGYDRPAVAITLATFGDQLQMPRLLRKLGMLKK